MLCLADNLKCQGKPIYIDQLNKAYKFVTEVCADEAASFQISRILALDDCAVLAIMPKRPPLADRAVIVDIANPLHQIVVKSALADNDAKSFCAFHCFPNVIFNTLVPPRIESSDRNDC